MSNRFMASYTSKHIKQRNTVVLIGMLLFCIACSNNTDSLKRKDTHSTKPEARSSKRQNMGHPEGTGSSGGSGSGGDTGGSSGSSGSAGSGSSGSAGSGSSGSAGSGGSGSVGSGGSSNVGSGGSGSVGSGGSGSVGSGGSGSVGSGDEVLGVSGDGKEASELRRLKKVNSTESLKEDVSSSEEQSVLEIGMLGEASELRRLKKVNRTESLKEDVPSSEEQPHTVLEIGSNIDTITHPDVSKKVCFYCKKPEIKERETLKSLFMKSVDWLGDFILPSVPYGPFICRECKRKSFIV